MRGSSGEECPPSIVGRCGKLYIYIYLLGASNGVYWSAVMRVCFMALHDLNAHIVTEQFNGIKHVRWSPLIAET